MIVAGRHIVKQCLAGILFPNLDALHLIYTRIMPGKREKKHVVGFSNQWPLIRLNRNVLSLDAVHSRSVSMRESVSYEPRVAGEGPVNSRPLLSSSALIGTLSGL